MKTYVSTTHRITTDVTDDFAIQIGCDKIVRLEFDATYKIDDGPRSSTRWLGREDLIAIRGLINCALDLI